MSLRPQPRPRADDGTEAVAHTEAILAAARFANAAFLRDVGEATPAPVPVPTDAPSVEDLIHQIQFKNLSGETENQEANALVDLIKILDNAIASNQVLLLDAKPNPLPVKPGDPSYLGANCHYLVEPMSDLESVFEARNLAIAKANSADKASNWFALIDRLPEGAKKKIGKGGYNQAYMLDLTDGAVPAWFQMMFGPGNRSQVVMREALNDPTKPVEAKQFFQELYLMAYASRLGVGPQQYASIVQLMPDAQKERVSFKDDGNFSVFGKKPFLLHKYALRVLSFSRAYDGDNHTLQSLYGPNMLIWHDTGDGDPWPPVPKNYWEKVVEAIVKASKAGFVHGDLKRANMLFKMERDPDTGEIDDTKIAEMRYTDFDPHFVRVVDMTNPKNRGLERCIALLMMLSYLTEIICHGSVNLDNDELATVIDNAMYELFAVLKRDRRLYADLETDHKTAVDALMDECGFAILKAPPRPSRGAPSSYAGAVAGNLDVGEENRDPTRYQIAKALKAHAYGYMIRRESKNSRNERCLDPSAVDGDDAKGGSIRAFDRLVRFALQDWKKWPKR